MKIFSTDTLQSYDKFKSNVFHSKINEVKESMKKQKVKFKSPYRFMAKILLIGAIGYSFYYYSNSINRLFFTEKAKQSMQQYYPLSKQLTFQVLYDITKLNFPYLVKQQKLDAGLPNKLYYTKLQSMLMSMQLKKKNILIFQSRKMRFMIYGFGIGGQKKIVEINQFGDIVEKQSKGMIVIGNVGLLQKKRKVLKRNFTTQKLSQEAQTIANEGVRFNLESGCSGVNKLNSVILSEKQHNDLLTQCIQRVKAIEKDIVKQYKKQIKKYPLNQ